MNIPVLQRRKQTALVFMSVAAVLVAVFVFRLPAKPVDHAIGSGSHMTLFFMKQWERSGGASSLFSFRAVIERSVAEQVVSLRGTGDFYSSFPPGAALFPYATFRMLGIAVSYWHLLLFSRSLQCASAFLAAVIAIFLSGFSGSRAFAVGMLSAFLFLTNPLIDSMYEVNYFHSTASIFPIFAVLCAEVIRGEKTRRRTQRLQSVALFVCAITDWSAFPLALSIAAKRKLFGRERISLGMSTLLFAPVFAAWTFFALQLHHQGSFLFFWNKFLQRTGAKHFHISEFIHTYPEHLTNAFAPTGLAAMLLSLVAAVCAIVLQSCGGRHENTERRQAFLAFVFLSVAPFAAQTVLLSQHSTKHFFSPYFFAPYFAVVPFVCFPVFILSFVRSAKIRAVFNSLFFLIACAMIAYQVRSNRPDALPSPAQLDRVTSRDASLQALYDSYGRDATYFSPNIPVYTWDGVDYESREATLSSEKVIYPFTSLADISSYRDRTDPESRSYRLIYVRKPNMSLRKDCPAVSDAYVEWLVNMGAKALPPVAEIEVFSLDDSVLDRLTKKGTEPVPCKQ